MHCTGVVHSLTLYLILNVIIFINFSCLVLKTLSAFDLLLFPFLCSALGVAFDV